MALQNIAHVRHNRDGAPHLLTGANHLQTEKQTFLESGGINHAENMSYRLIGKRLLEMRHRHSLFFRNRAQGISAREIDQIVVGQARQLTHRQVDRNARIICHAMIETGQAIEQRRLTRIRGPDQ